LNQWWTWLKRELLLLLGRLHISQWIASILELFLLLLDRNFVLIALLHHILIVKNGVGKLLLEYILSEEGLDAAGYDWLLEDLIDGQSFLHVDDQKL
jgi:hypothetical protein